MIIQSSQLTLGSHHQFKQVEEEQEQLRYWRNGQTRADAEQAVSRLEIKSDKITLDFRQDRLSSTTAVTTKPASPIESEETSEDIKNGWKLTLLRRLVENLTGKKIIMVKTSDLPIEPATVGSAPAAPAAGQTPAGEQASVGWGLEYHYQHSYLESERTQFAAQGKVLTADGRELDINVTLSMSRAFASHESIHIRAGDALKDPLVINYSGSAAQLTETDLHFDLDLDGTTEQLQFVSPGSGFLALDKNGDGQINNGSELFGPSSGDGFADLAVYDSDGNNWIDENDSIYEHLRIWERDSEGNFSLLALGQRGIGAIYLDRIETPFSIKDQQNQLQGQIRSSGVFLHENGSAGTIQQLDLVV